MSYIRMLIVNLGVVLVLAACGGEGDEDDENEGDEDGSRPRVTLVASSAGDQTQRQAI